MAKQILGGLTNDAEAVEAMANRELESLIAARRVLAPSYALHVAVEEHAQAISSWARRVCGKRWSSSCVIIEQTFPD